jgi:hypothetical protein
MAEVWSTNQDQWRQAASLRAQGPKPQAAASFKPQAPQYDQIHMNIKDKIKEMKKEIERLKKLTDYEYVILDIQEEIKCLKKKLTK